MRFKPGDVVKCINSNNTLSNGKEYTIISYGLSEVGGHRYNNIKKMYCD